MKVQGPSPVCSLPKKVGNILFDLGYKSLRVEVVLKDVSVRENGAKMHVVQEYSLACPRIKL
jgi:hypothetical protein